MTARRANAKTSRFSSPTSATRSPGVLIAIAAVFARFPRSSGNSKMQLKWALVLGTAAALVPRRARTAPKPTQLYNAIKAPFESPHAQQYVVCARRAIDDGAFDTARKTYAYYHERHAPRHQMDAAKMVLRWALLEQRALNATGARAVFKLGARAVHGGLRSGDADLKLAAATLFCSWGLAEYRHRAELGSKDAVRATALLRHATTLDASKAPVLKWRMFAKTEEPPPKKKMVPPPRRKPVSELPAEGSEDDPFALNVWKRRIAERFAKFHDDLLSACARDDRAAVEAAATVLERRSGKRTIARSKDLVGAWTLRWAGARSEGCLVVRGPGGVTSVPDGPKSPKDPFLDVGTAYGCDGLAKALEPLSDRTVALAGFAWAPDFECTYLDERVWIGRDAEGAAVVFARDQ